MSGFNRPNQDFTGTVVEYLGENIADSEVLTPLNKLATGHLPTEDPAVAGALWNDAGAVKVSAGS